MIFEGNDNDDDAGDEDDDDDDEDEDEDEDDGDGDGDGDGDVPDIGWWAFTFCPRLLLCFQAIEVIGADAFLVHVILVMPKDVLERFANGNVVTYGVRENARVLLFNHLDDFNKRDSCLAVVNQQAFARVA